MPMTNNPFLSRPLISPAIAGFRVILSPPKNNGIFCSCPNLLELFPAQICLHFVPIRHCRHFFFLPEMAGIFSDPKLLAYLLTQNCWHIFGPKLAGISSDPKLPDYFPSRNCWHIFRPEISGIISTRNSGI